MGWLVGLGKHMSLFGDYMWMRMYVLMFDCEIVVNLFYMNIYVYEFFYVCMCVYMCI